MRVPLSLCEYVDSLVDEEAPGRTNRSEVVRTILESHRQGGDASRGALVTAVRDAQQRLRGFQKDVAREFQNIGMRLLDELLDGSSE